MNAENDREKVRFETSNRTMKKKSEINMDASTLKFSEDLTLLELIAKDLKRGQGFVLDDQLLFSTDYGPFLCFRNDGSFTCVLEKGLLWEQKTIEKYMTPFIANSRVILDVGAHAGGHTLMFAKMSPKSVIYAFEPQKKMFQVLQRNLRINHIEKQVIARQCAVAHCSGQTRMSRKSTDGAAVEVIEYGGTRVQNLGGIQVGVDGNIVDMISIDDLRLPGCNLIKIDVEGCEPLVLLGAQKTIQQFQPTILFEYNWKRITPEMCEALKLEKHDKTWQTTSFEILDKLNYRYARIDEDNYVALPAKFIK